MSGMWKRSMAVIRGTLADERASNSEPNLGLHHRATSRLYIHRRESRGHACRPWGKRTCLTFAGNTTAVRLEERLAGHSWGAWELGFLRLLHRGDFGSGLTIAAEMVGCGPGPFHFASASTVLPARQQSTSKHPPRRPVLARIASSISAPTRFFYNLVSMRSRPLFPLLFFRGRARDPSLMVQSTSQ